MPVGRSGGYTKRIGDFRDRHPDEIAELDHLGGHRVLGSQRIERIVNGQDFCRRSGQLNSRFVEFLRWLIAAALLARFAARFIDQDTSHGLGRCSKKMRSPVPLLPIGPCQLQPGFMNQSGGLQGLPGSLTGHPGSGEFAKLFVNQRQQLPSRVGVPLFNRLQNARHVTHGLKEIKLRPRRQNAPAKKIVQSNRSRKQYALEVFDYLERVPNVEWLPFREPAP
jgi:hypothetical protein